MINVLYFANIREALGREQESLELPEGVKTVAQLMSHLAHQHGQDWERIMTQRPVLVAVNQDMTQKSAPVQDGDEVAFFPPVTGG